MKKHLLILLCIGLLFSCSNGGKDPNNIDDPDNPPVPGQKTLIIFDNTRGNSTVSVFHDHRRRNEDKITEVPARQLSGEIEWTPGASVPFYFSYLIKLTGINNFSFYYTPEIGKDQTAVRIDENKKNNITVPKLEETLSSEDQLLSNDTYLLIRNNSSYSFQLQQGTSSIRPDNSTGSSVVNAGEKAQYKIISGTNTNYQLLVGADYKPVPEPDGGFKAGCFYSYIYNGNVTLDSQIFIILENINSTLTNFPPPNISASGISYSSIKITWDAVPEASGYKIYRSSEASSNYALITTCTGNSYTDTGLSPSTVYYYKVSTLGINGESEQSNPISAETLEAPPIPVPFGLSATSLSSNSIQVSWTAVSEATGYRIYRSDWESGSYALVGTNSTTSYTNTGLSPLTLYYYKVSTVHSRGESEKSSPVSAMTQAEPDIQPPGGISASTLGTSSIQVSWSGVTGAISYKVYRASSASGNYNFIGNAASSPYTDSGLSASSTWYYKVSSVKDSQESVLSSSYASATTQSSGGSIDYPPVMPTGLVVSSVSSGSITITWNAVSTASSYNVYRSNTQTGAEAKINTSPVTDTSYTNNVPAGAAYYYKVVAVNNSGESPKSAGTFAYAASHYTLSYYDGTQTLSLPGRSTHYYRLSVTQGASYTIEWQNGNNQNINWNMLVDAYQNDGTTIFSGAYNGYTGPKVFTATATGFVTVRIRSDTDSNLNYQIYYY